MKFLDPLPTTCDRCSAKSTQRVADLLSLRAFCPSCGASLAEMGAKMRVTIDEVETFYQLMEIALELEDKVGITISDTELAGVKTLRQFAAIVQLHLPPSPEAEARALKLTTAAAGKRSACKAEEISLDAPLMDALAPNRWTATEGEASAPSAQGEALGLGHRPEHGST